MGFPMTFLAFRNIRMLSPVAEGAGECLVLGHCFCHQLPNLPMTRLAERPWRGLGSVDLQRMMGRMATQAIRG